MSERFGKPSLAVAVCALVFTSALPIAHLVIGAIYQSECPKQRLIPIYLMVLGATSLLLAVLSNLPGNVGKVCGSLISLFCFCWFIAGNVWIYSIYEPNYNKTASIDTYCNRTLYLFAFWTTNLNYILLGLIILCACCSMFCF